MLRRVTTSFARIHSVGNTPLIMRPHPLRREFSSALHLLQENNNNNNNTAQETKQNENGTTEQQQTTNDTTNNKEVQELKEKLQAMEAKAKEFENKYKSSLAEMQNVRRIAKTDVDNEKKFAIQKFASNLLDVADNFERATQNVSEDDVNQITDFLTAENSGASEELVRRARTLRSVFQGVKMTENILQKTFTSFGVERMDDVLGGPFDPAFHDAVVKQNLKEGDDKSKVNTVTHVLKTGYKIKDRVLRPAQVVVCVEEE